LLILLLLDKRFIKNMWRNFAWINYFRACVGLNIAGCKWKTTCPPTQINTQLAPTQSHHTRGFTFEIPGFAQYYRAWNKCTFTIIIISFIVLSNSQYIGDYQQSIKAINEDVCLYLLCRRENSYIYIYVYTWLLPRVYECNRFLFYLLSCSSCFFRFFPKL